MDKLDRRTQFYQKLGELICNDAERRKNEISLTGDEARAERRRINEKKQEDLRLLRYYYWGRKTELHCYNCPYFDYWEKMEFSTKKD